MTDTDPLATLPAVLRRTVAWLRDPNADATRADEHEMADAILDLARENERLRADREGFQGEANRSLLEIRALREEITELKGYNAWLDNHDKATRERDEARAEVERLQHYALPVDVQSRIDAEVSRRVGDWLEAPPAQMSYSGRLVPINSTGMREVIDEATQLRKANVLGAREQARVYEENDRLKAILNQHPRERVGRVVAVLEAGLMEDLQVLDVSTFGGMLTIQVAPPMADLRTRDRLERLRSALPALVELAWKKGFVCGMQRESQRLDPRQCDAQRIADLAPIVARFEGEK